MKKKFDCVEMKRQGAAFVQAQLQGKSREEELEFWKTQDERLRKLQEESQKQPAAAVHSSTP